MTRRPRLTIDDGQPRRRYQPLSREACRTIAACVLATPETARTFEETVSAAPTGQPQRCYSCHRDVAPEATGCPHCHRSFLD